MASIHAHSSILNFGSRFVASGLTLRSNRAFGPPTASHKDAIASALEADHGSQYLLLAYTILDDCCSVILLHRPATDIDAIRTGWNAEIRTRISPIRERQHDASLFLYTAAKLYNAAQIATAINVLVTEYLRKPYVNDDYRWLRIIPVWDAEDIVGIDCADPCEIWS